MKRLLVMGVLLSLLTATGVSAALAAPADNDQKIVDILDYLSDPLAHDITEHCGFDIEAEVSGWIQQKGSLLEKPYRVVHNYHIDMTFWANDKTYQLSTSGVWRAYIQDGEHYRFLAGRWESWEGLRGHVLYGPPYDTLLKEVGKTLFEDSYPDQVCQALR
jgi:hypothetical protein